MDANQIAEKARDKANKAQEGVKNVADKAVDAGECAKETGREIAGKAAEVGQRARGAVKDAGAAADLYLHEYAWTTMVAVALVSGAVGYMLGRRS